MLTQIKPTIDNISIDQTEKPTFLGIIINQNLFWTDYISLLKNKISKNIGFIGRIRKNLPLYTLRMLYYALINSYYDYCNIVWGIERYVHFENLFKLQKKAVRVIIWSKWNCHSTSIFKQHDILQLFDINLVQMTCFIYRSLNGQLPPMFKDYFVQHLTVRNHITRHCLNLQLPLHRTNIRANSIRVSGLNFWMELY